MCPLNPSSSYERKKTAVKRSLICKRFWSAKSGTRCRPETVTLTPPDSPAVCFSFYEWASFSVTISALLSDDALWSKWFYIQVSNVFTDYIITNIIWFGALMLYAVLNKSWTISWHMEFYFSFRAGLVTKYLSIHVGITIIWYNSLLSTCILNTIFLNRLHVDLNTTLPL